MSDLIEAALASENAESSRAALGALRRAEDTAKWSMKSALEKRAERLAPCVKAAHRAFHDAAIPRALRRHVWLNWAGNDGPSTNYDDRDKVRGYGATLHVRFEISVGSATYTAPFCPKSLADCVARGWATWPVVEAMVRSQLSHLPMDSAAALDAHNKALDRKKRKAKGGGR